MKELINELQKRYNVNPLRVAVLYSKGLSREKIVNKLNSTDMVIRTILLRLNLRMKKKFRELDYFNFKQKLKETKDINKEIEKELVESIDLLEKQNLKIENLQTKNRILNKLLKNTYKLQNEYEVISKVVKDNYQPFEITLKVGNKTDKQGILVLSDIHYGEIIEKSITNNEYNSDIAKQYLIDIFNKVNYDDIEQLNIFLIGDLIQGLIHDLDDDTIPVPQQAIELAEILSNIFKEVKVPLKIFMVNGNHSRIKDYKKNKNKAIDYEYIIAEILKIRGFEVEYSLNGYLVANIYNHIFGLMHGDTVNFNPSNETDTIKVQQIFKQFTAKDIQSIIAGHTHIYRNSANILGGFNIVNGCLSGNNEYGLGNGYYPLKSKIQVYFTIDKQHNFVISPLKVS